MFRGWAFLASLRLSVLSWLIMWEVGLFTSACSIKLLSHRAAKMKTARAKFKDWRQ